MELNVLTPAEAAYYATRCALNGRAVKARGLATNEVQNFTVHVNYPFLSPYLPERNARHFIGAVEALQLVGQAALPEIVEGGSKVMGRFLDYGTFWGAYGVRVYGQLGNIYQELNRDHGTRRAVLSIYDGPRDLGRDVLDIPCTLTLQFMWEVNRLALRVSMRSNDVWLGLPYDLFQFTTLQCAMADALGVEPGMYTHTVGSLHIYEPDVNNALTLRGPAQPASHELVYQRRFPDVGIGEISSRCRRILLGSEISNPTSFELYLKESLL